MSDRRFWPGFHWRVLAHHTTQTNSNRVYTGEQVKLRHDPDDPVLFDELVIDHWFHLEQMDDRIWWLGIGTAEDGVGYAYNINVTIDADRKAHVSIEGDI